MFICASFCGVIGELLCVRLGIWMYSYPSIAGIPIWLPLAWGNAVVFISWISELLFHKIKKQQ